MPGSFRLETDRLVLRLPTHDDLDALAAIFADPAVMRYIGDGSTRSRERVAQSIDRSVSIYRASRRGIFVAEERGTGTIIGDGLLVPILRSGVDTADFDARGPEIEVGYRLGRAHWGRGYATEIARALTVYALAHSSAGGAGVAPGELVAVTHAANAPSQRVLMKTGFTPAGLTNRFYNMPTMLFVWPSEGPSGGPSGARPGAEPARSGTMGP